jgi:hypothetical protein
MTRENHFKLAKAWAWLGLASVLLLPINLLIAWYLGPRGTAGLSGLSGIDPIMLSLGMFVVTAIGTGSAILLGWRSDRREAAEMELRIEQLELQLAEARAKALQSVTPGPSGGAASSI